MRNSLNDLTFLIGGFVAVLIAILVAVAKDLAVTEVRVCLERRITRSFEATVDALPDHVQDEWAEEWRAELAAIISAPFAATSFVRGIRRAAVEFVQEPVVPDVGAHDQSLATCAGAARRWPLPHANVFEGMLARGWALRGWLAVHPVIRLGLLLVQLCAPGLVIALLGHLSPSLLAGVIDGGVVGFLLAWFIVWLKSDVDAPRSSEARNDAAAFRHSSQGVPETPTIASSSLVSARCAAPPHRHEPPATPPLSG